MRSSQESKQEKVKPLRSKEARMVCCTMSLKPSSAGAAEIIRQRALAGQRQRSCWEKLFISSTPYTLRLLSSGPVGLLVRKIVMEIILLCGKIKNSRREGGLFAILGALTTVHGQK